MNQAPTGKYAERIERGAAFLDEKVPGWREKIDLDKLDIRASSHCVVGQATDDYFANVEDSWFGEDFYDAAVAHGFEWDLDDDAEDLTAEWRQYIEATR